MESNYNKYNNSNNNDVLSTMVFIQINILYYHDLTHYATNPYLGKLLLVSDIVSPFSYNPIIPSIT
jgi:hypothetical protein